MPMVTSTLKSLIKSVLEFVAPARYRAFMSRRSNRHAQWVMDQHGVPAISAAFIGRHGDKVIGGPFTGMTYVTRSAGSSFLPKLIGSYECELHEPLQRILKTSYDVVIDVGSAEGYYAVGLALHLPGSARVYAFDLDEGAQAMCRELASKNNVLARVVVEGFCDTGRLQALLGARSLVVSDCEGFETELLDPERVPALRNAEILVELHDFLKPGTTATLTRRFSGTHDIQLFDSRDRDPADYPAVSFLAPHEQKVALSEFRTTRMQWAVMTPKATLSRPVQ